MKKKESGIIWHRIETDCPRAHREFRSPVRVENMHRGLGVEGPSC
jgi:hypothetical protein